MRLKLKKKRQEKCALCGWPHGHEKENFNIKEVVIDVLIFLLVIYVMIAGISLLQVAEGVETSYMAFWHAPVKWLLNTFFKP